MPNTSLIIDIAQLFKSTFGGKPYIVPGLSTDSDQGDDHGYKISGFSERPDLVLNKKGAILKEQYRGVEIFLPIRLFDESKMLMYLPYCVISVSGGKTIIETPMAERVGTVKEQFNIDDYVFNVKGFLIGADRQFPEEEIVALQELHETTKAVKIDNALTSLFLMSSKLKPEEQRRVVVYRFDMPEVQGGREHVRPFTMTLKSDTVFTLELDENFT